MAQTEYYSYQDNQALGKVGVSLQVFDVITKLTLMDIKEVTVDFPHGIFNYGKGPIVCRIIDSTLQIDVELKVNYGQNVTAISKLVQKKISDAVMRMTDVTVDYINVNVTGIEFN